ncbi:MAG: hypothetical protein WCA21_18960 [Terracidiphilus sp.]
MNYGLSDQVRAVALEKYVHPAIRAGKMQFSVAVRDLMRHLQAEGFPEKNWPQVCTAIQAEKFLRTNGLEIEGIDGPPSKKSTTVVVRYRVADTATRLIPQESSPNGGGIDPTEESPEEWAFRVTEKMRGLLKEELAEYGGGEAFLRWIRSEDEDAA